MVSHAQLRQWLDVSDLLHGGRSSTAIDNVLDMMSASLCLLGVHALGNRWRIVGPMGTAYTRVLVALCITRKAKEGLANSGLTLCTKRCVSSTALSKSVEGEGEHE